MPQAALEREIVVAAEPATCWETLTDVDKLIDWVGILGEVETLRPLAKYRAVLEERMGPFKLRADLDIAVVDVAQGLRICFEAEGEDREAGSRIKVDACLVIEPENNGSRVRASGQYEVTGRVATLGASMIRRRAEQAVDEFFERAQAELE